MSRAEAVTVLHADLGADALTGGDAGRGFPVRDGTIRDGAIRDGVGPEEFRAVLRHHAKGVAIITANGRWPVGFCATSLASVSLRPPLLSFSVGLGTESWQAIAEAAHVMVHLLNDEQSELADVFAMPGADKFGPGIDWRYGEFGLPRLDGVLASIALAVVSRFEVGDHAVVVGRVVYADHDQDGGQPLVHHDGAYVRIAPPRHDCLRGQGVVSVAPATDAGGTCR